MIVLVFGITRFLGEKEKRKKKMKKRKRKKKIKKKRKVFEGKRGGKGEGRERLKGLIINCFF